MNVLSIMPYPVLPLTHGGRVRAYRLARGLARAGARVELCCPWHPELPLGPFEREGIRIRPFVFASSILPALLGDRLVPPLLQLSMQPLTPGPRRLLRRASRFDVVEFHFCAYASWMRRVSPDYYRLLRSPTPPATAFCTPRIRSTRRSPSRWSPGFPSVITGPASDVAMRGPRHSGGHRDRVAPLGAAATAAPGAASFGAMMVILGLSTACSSLSSSAVSMSRRENRR